MKKKSSAGPPAGRCASSRSRLRLRRTVAAAILSSLAVLAALLLLPPDPGLRRAERSLEGVVITDRHGQVLHRIPGNDGSFMHRLGRDELPDRVREVLVRVEDKRFHYHPGVDPLAVARSALLNLDRGRVVSGASTITMQLARILTPHGGGTGGKLREAWMALRLEARLSKEEILLLYANRLPFGRNARGVAAAAVTYFDRPVDELSRAQVLLLAVIPRAPTRYDPFRQPEALRRKARELAPRVGVSAAEVDAALATVRRGRPELRAPHFVRALTGAAGGSPRFPPILPPGVRPGEVTRIVTTLDLGLTETLAGRIDRELARTAGEPSASGTASGPSEASALVLDNRGGEVLAWVGARNSELDGVLARSSSGSTLKPFLYALALERGWTPASLLPDLGLSFGGGPGGGPADADLVPPDTDGKLSESYRPQNFDRRNRGLVRLRTALASSLNVPAVYLLSRLGLEDFLALCGRLGFELPSGAAARLGLAASVGNVEASLLELVRAFSVFPRAGTQPHLRVVREVRRADGSVEAMPASGAGPRGAGAPGGPAGRTGGADRVFSRETAWLIRDILSDAAARAPGFGAASRFNTPFPAMFKSGTASEYTSLWCLGATERVTVGAWAGNFDGRSSYGVTGSSLPAGIVVETLREIEAGPGFPQPEPEPSPGPRPRLAEARICTLTGAAASPACPATRPELFPPGREPREICPVHTGRESFESLSARVLLQGRQGPRILFPLNGSVFYRDGGLPEGGQSIGTWIAARPEEKLEVALNGRPLTLSDPFELHLPVHPGRYRLEVAGRSGRDAVTYTVR